jgi:hypothetical protein
MEPLHTDSVKSLRLPLLLTVEEAGALLRVGRTKAYAMAREWRETDGRSGLPVIDLGHVLRVPRHALEEMVGVQLVDEIPVESEPSTNSKPRTRPNQRRTRSSDQLDLFDTTDD